jgi:hypothetical protein
MLQYDWLWSGHMIIKEMFLRRARTHAVLVIGLYELFGNPTIQLIEPPGAFKVMIKPYTN